MNVKQKAPCKRGRTCSAASHVLPEKVESRAVTREVSLVESIESLVTILARSSRERSQASNSSVLVRLPLCARARPPFSVGRYVGWAFFHTEAPVVEYRSCPIARCPVREFSVGSSKTWDTRPMSLKTMIRSPLLTAMPADS